MAVRLEGGDLHVDPGPGHYQGKVYVFMRKDAIHILVEDKALRLTADDARDVIAYLSYHLNNTIT